VDVRLAELLHDGGTDTSDDLKLAAPLLVCVENVMR
jgi:hypothetical protein